MYSVSQTNLSGQDVQLSIQFVIRDEPMWDFPADTIRDVLSLVSGRYCTNYDVLIAIFNAPLMQRFRKIVTSSVGKSEIKSATT